MAITTGMAILGAAGLGAGASIFGGNKAAKAQEKGVAESNAIAKQVSADQIALQREQFNKTLELQQPMIDAGNTSRNRLMQLLGLSAGGADNGSAMRDFSMADFQSDPGYEFRMNEGQKGLERSAAARGGLMSGGAMKDMARFSQGQASQEYQAAFDRFQTNRSSKLNPLLSLSGSGQVAAGTAGAAGQNFASGASSALGQYGATTSGNAIGSANARASGYVNTANAVTGALGTAVNGYQQNQLMGLLAKQKG